MAEKLTDLLIKNLKPKDKEHIVREKGGFGVRVMPSGRKVFFFMYRVDGQRRFLNLGTYKDTNYPNGVKLADAHAEFEAELSKVTLLKAGRAEGVDPVLVKLHKKTEREEIRLTSTVDDLIDDYVKKHAMKFKRSWQEDERLLMKDASPAWGKRKAADIKKRDVVLLLEKIVERGSPGTANSVFRCTRKMFNWAVERDILEHSPCEGVKMPAPINTGVRTLSETEIKTLWNNLDTASISAEIKRAIKLIFVSAQRPGEVVGMHTDEIDKDGRWWTIPIERSKNKKAHRVYLTDSALELIGDLTVKEKKTGKDVPKGFIFACPISKKIQSISEKSLSKAIRRNLEWPVLLKGKPVFAADGTPITENRLGVEHFTPHDGRRTAATFMSQLGCVDEIIDAVLNHTKQGIIKTYNLNKYDKEKQQALEAWACKLIIIVTGKEGSNSENKVV
jgi:integrase